MEGTKTKVECPHKDDCCDVDSEKCHECINNKKRSYYRHKDYSNPIYPYYPSYPYYPDYWQPYYPYCWQPSDYPYYTTTTSVGTTTLPLDTASVATDTDLNCATSN